MNVGGFEPGDEVLVLTSPGRVEHAVVMDVFNDGTVVEIRPLNASANNIERYEHDEIALTATARIARALEAIARGTETS